MTIDIEANQVATVTVALDDNFVELDGIMVQGNRQGQARALSQQKTADNIKNVVAADLIGRFPDPNVADALRRVPAVSVQRDQGEARYIQVRGTNPNRKCQRRADSFPRRRCALCSTRYDSNRRAFQH